MSATLHICQEPLLPSNPVVIFPNLCLVFHFESGTTPGTLHVLTVFKERLYAGSQAYFWLALIRIKSFFIFHMGFAWKNPTSQSQVYFVFICEVIRRITAAARACPCELNRAIKTSPDVKVEHAEIELDVSSIPCHPLHRLWPAQGGGRRKFWDLADG
jgi:hypothetical protein